MPEGIGPFPGVVVCHPHPLHGGDMFNSVVGSICRSLAEKNIAAFRFNFRGVGGSQGSYGEGIAEQEDIKAALDYMFSSPDIDTEKTGLAGYSFGAMVALKVALRDERIHCLTLVSAPLSDYGWQQLKDYGNPKLYLVGEADQMIPQERFRQQVKDVPRPEQYQTIPRADHFWGGYESEMAQKVTEFFSGCFGQR